MRYTQSTIREPVSNALTAVIPTHTNAIDPELENTGHTFGTNTSVHGQFGSGFEGVPYLMSEKIRCTCYSHSDDEALAQARPWETGTETDRVVPVKRMDNTRLYDTIKFNIRR